MTTQQQSLLLLTQHICSSEKPWVLGAGHTFTVWVKHQVWSRDPFHTTNWQSFLSKSPYMGSESSAHIPNRLLTPEQRRAAGALLHRKQPGTSVRKQPCHWTQSKHLWKNNYKIFGNSLYFTGSDWIPGLAVPKYFLPLPRFFLLQQKTKNTKQGCLICSGNIHSIYCFND